MSFTRHIEDFTCENCGLAVVGDGYTNHCPQCLYSLHVDIDPGDRAAHCRGLMQPIASRFVDDNFIILQRCRSCDHQKTNRAAPSDDRNLLISLSANPIIE